MENLSLFLGDTVTLPTGSPSVTQELETQHPELALSHLINQTTFNYLFEKQKTQYITLINQIKTELEANLRENHRFKAYYKLWESLKTFPPQIHDMVVLYAQFNAYRKMPHAKKIVSEKIFALFPEIEKLAINKSQIIEYLRLNEEIKYIQQQTNTLSFDEESLGAATTLLARNDYTKHVPERVQLFYNKNRLIEKRKDILTGMMTNNISQLLLLFYFCDWIFVELNPLVIG
jgi:hypothetical protein